MKTIAALIAGLILSIATFVGGVATSTIFFNIGKTAHRTEDTAALWTREPVKIDKKNQSFKRLPARPVPEESVVASVNKAGVGGTPKDQAVQDTEAVADDPQMLVDPTTIGSIDPVKPETNQRPQTQQQTTAHVEWCSRHYRSYRVDDNSYKPYGGDRRQCESPYSNTTTADLQPDRASDRNESGKHRSLDNVIADESQADVQQASYANEEGDYLDSDHVQSCLRRYNSYRPEDNTYQPYDGGPRKQCR
jgi:hypothetical protein